MSQPKSESAESGREDVRARVIRERMAQYENAGSQEPDDDRPSDQEVYDDLPGYLYRPTSSSKGCHIPEVVENDDGEWVEGEEDCPHAKKCKHLKHQLLEAYYGPEELEFCTYCVRQFYELFGGED